MPVAFFVRTGRPGRAILRSLCNVRVSSGGTGPQRGFGSYRPAASRPLVQPAGRSSNHRSASCAALVSSCVVKQSWPRGVQIPASPTATGRPADLIRQNGSSSNRMRGSCIDRPGHGHALPHALGNLPRQAAGARRQTRHVQQLIRLAAVRPRRTGGRQTPSFRGATSADRAGSRGRPCRPAAAAAGSSVAGRPNQRTSPAVGRATAARHLSSVVLPDPFAPVSARLWPAATSRSICRSTQRFAELLRQSADLDRHLRAGHA